MNLARMTQKQINAVHGKGSFITTAFNFVELDQAILTFNRVFAADSKHDWLVKSSPPLNTTAPHNTVHPGLHSPKVFLPVFQITL
jgi:hypothetical protein